MLTTIPLVKQKGGVGKSTTTLNLGAGLVRSGKRVFLIDANPQANLTEMMGWQQPDGLDVTLSSFVDAFSADRPLPWQGGILHSAEGPSIFTYDPRGKVAATYESFTQEVLAIERQKQESQPDRLR